MVQSQLSAYSGSDPIWGFVALVRSELFTGEAAVGLDPRVRLFAVDGHIYFAEREDDLPVGTRLVNCGVITAMQLARGAVQAGGHESLARMFQRDATIDRDAVELTIASSTETLLASIAQQPVGMPEVFALRQHPAGLHHWLRPTPSPIELEVESVAVTDAAATVDLVEAQPIVELEPIVVADPIMVAQPVAIASPPVTPEWPLMDDEPTWAVSPDAIETPPAAQPVLAEPVAATAHGLPKLAPLHSAPPSFAKPLQPPATAALPSSESPEPALAPPSAFEPAPAVFEDPSLPKLAAGPISMNDLKTAAAASEPWTSTSNNMAAVQIWEMVDDLFDDGQHEELRVGGGAPQERNRGWLRKKH